MILQIVKKEILHNLHSIRFPALLVIAVALLVLNGILAITEPVQGTHNPSPSTVGITASRQHDMLQFCVRGTTADRIQKMRVMIGGDTSPAAMDNPGSLPAGDRLSRFALPYADRIDWAFIIKIVFSLFAIIFTFDAVCLERERGTLCLMCSNPVSRSSILLGKYLGACGTIIIPLMVGIVINLLIINIGMIAGAASLKPEHWLRLGLMAFSSVVYISLFILLGLLVSIAAKRASSSLLILLSFWVAMIIVLPNLAGIVAEHTVKMESEYELSKRQRQVWDLGGMGELDKQIESGKIKTQEDLNEAAEVIFTRMMEIINDTQAKHQAALVEKRRSARRIARISPAAIYQYTAEAIADSGFERQQRFMQSIRDHYRIFEGYVRDKIGKVVPNAKWNFMTNRYIDGKNFLVSSPQPEEYKGDMSDFPYFSERPWSVLDSLRISLINLTILFLWNILFFVAAHYIFVKQSLR